MKLPALFLAAAAILALFGLTPFCGQDISDLQPVELLIVEEAEGGISLRTEGGLAAWGRNLENATAHLRAASSGTLLLDTVEHIICTGKLFPPEELMAIGLRPGTAVYLSPHVEDPDALKTYLRDKKDGATLGRLEEENASVPVLVTGEAGLYLPPQ